MINEWYYFFCLFFCAFVCVCESISFSCLGLSCLVCIKLLHDSYSRHEEIENQKQADDCVRNWAIRKWTIHARRIHDEEMNGEWVEMLMEMGTEPNNVIIELMTFSYQPTKQRALVSAVVPVSGWLHTRWHEISNFLVMTTAHVINAAIETRCYLLFQFWTKQETTTVSLLFNSFLNEVFVLFWNNLIT